MQRLHEDDLIGHPSLSASVHRAVFPKNLLSQNNRYRYQSARLNLTTEQLVPALCW